MRRNYPAKEPRSPPEPSTETTLPGGQLLYQTTYEPLHNSAHGGLPLYIKDTPVAVQVSLQVCLTYPSILGCSPLRADDPLPGTTHCWFQGVFGASLSFHPDCFLTIVSLQDTTHSTPYNPRVSHVVGQTSRETTLDNLSRLSPPQASPKNQVDSHRWQSRIDSVLTSDSNLRSGSLTSLANCHLNIALR